MSQLRLNPLAGRWVTISLDRAARPAAFSARTLPVESEPGQRCPFCPGHEDACPPALQVYGPEGSWKLRVVPNLYPAFDGKGSLSATNLGPVFTEAPANGSHEVVIFSPDHETSWADLESEQTDLAMAAVRDRFEQHTSEPGMRYTQAIINHGREAGASVHHPHAQLLAMPFVPKGIADEEAGFERFAGGCVLCTTLEAEVSAKHRVLVDEELVVAVAPYWSGSPFEMLIMPRTHESHLHRSTPEDLAAVGRALRSTLRRLRKVLGDVAYNVFFHTAPHHHDNLYHWHIHVIPKLTTDAGFELGTGVLINIVPPEAAAVELNRRI
ncbi:MAG: galactose-1-phosphate uridylyltransferase [Acidimicrobiales bacterium]